MVQSSTLAVILPDGRADTSSLLQLVKGGVYVEVIRFIKVSDNADVKGGTNLDRSDGAFARIEALD